MNVDTERFGKLDIAADKIVSLEGGIIGFERYTKFILLDFLEKSPLKWLQSTEDPSLAFVVCDPWSFFKDYKYKVNVEVRKEIELKKGEELAVLAVVTVPDDISQTSLNLLSPLVINISKKKGKQVILYDSEYTTKHRIFKFVKIKSDKNSEEHRKTRKSS